MSGLEVPWAVAAGVVTDGAAALGSRRRHPAGRDSGAHLVAPLARLVAALPEPQGPHWEVAFAVLAIRGGQARTRSGFATAYGLSPDDVGRLEAGAVPLDLVPAPLRSLTPVDVLVDQLARLPHPT